MPTMAGQERDQKSKLFRPWDRNHHSETKSEDSPLALPNVSSIEISNAIKRKQRTTTGSCKGKRSSAHGSSSARHQNISRLDNGNHNVTCVPLNQQSEVSCAPVHPCYNAAPTMTLSNSYLPGLPSNLTVTGRKHCPVTMNVPLTFPISSSSSSFVMDRTPNLDLVISMDGHCTAMEPTSVIHYPRTKCLESETPTTIMNTSGSVFLGLPQPIHHPETNLMSEFSESVHLGKTPKVKKQRPKRFPCPHCQVAFSNNGQLKGHVRIHTGNYLIGISFVCFWVIK